MVCVTGAHGHHPLAQVQEIVPIVDAARVQHLAVVIHQDRTGGRHVVGDLAFGEDVRDPIVMQQVGPAAVEHLEGVEIQAERGVAVLIVEGRPGLGRELPKEAGLLKVTGERVAEVLREVAQYRVAWVVDLDDQVVGPQGRSLSQSVEDRLRRQERPFKGPMGGGTGFVGHGIGVEVTAIQGRQLEPYCRYHPVAQAGVQDVRGEVSDVVVVCGHRPLNTLACQGANDIVDGHLGVDTSDRVDMHVAGDPAGGVHHPRQPRHHAHRLALGDGYFAHLQAILGPTAGVDLVGPRTYMKFHEPVVSRALRLDVATGRWIVCVGDHVTEQEGLAGVHVEQEVHRTLTGKLGGVGPNCTRSGRQPAPVAIHNSDQNATLTVRREFQPRGPAPSNLEVHEVRDLSATAGHSSGVVSGLEGPHEASPLAWLVLTEDAVLAVGETLVDEDIAVHARFPRQPVGDFTTDQPGAHVTYIVNDVQNAPHVTRTDRQVLDRLPCLAGSESRRAVELEYSKEAARLEKHQQ